MHDVTTKLSKFKLWFTFKKLSLNMSGTKIMYFGKCRSNMQIKVSLDGLDIG